MSFFLKNLSKKYSIHAEEPNEYANRKQREPVTHANFDAALENVRKGKSVLVIPAAYKWTVINQKTLKKWEAKGLTLLRKDSDGHGFRMSHGKGSVYLFKAQLFEMDANDPRFDV